MTVTCINQFNDLQLQVPSTKSFGSFRNLEDPVLRLTDLPEEVVRIALQFTDARGVWSFLCIWKGLRIENLDFWLDFNVCPLRLDRFLHRTGLKIRSAVSVIGYASLLHLTLDGTIGNWDALGVCNSLVRVNMTCCQGFRRIPFRSRSLVFLKVSKCYDLIDITMLGSSTKLEVIDLSSCSSMADVAVLQCSKSVRIADLSNSSVMVMFQAHEGLRHLNLQGCSHLYDISGLQPCTKLEYLDIRYCPGVTRNDVVALELHTSLQVAKFTGTECDSSVVENCRFLREVELSNSFPSLYSLGTCHNLQSVRLNSGSLVDITELRHCSHLIYVNFSHCRRLVVIDALEHCRKMKFVYLASTGIRSLNPLGHCLDLEILDVCCCFIHDLTPISTCRELQQINLLHTQVQKCDPIQDLANLTDINLSQSLLGTDVSLCPTSLEVLSLEKCDQLQHLRWNRDCAVKLRHLNLKYTDLRSVDFLRPCQHLTFLDLSYTQVTDYSTMSLCLSLRTLKLCGSSLSNVDMICTLTELEHLDLEGSGALVDMSGVLGCTKLKILNINTTGVKNLVSGSSLQRLDLGRSQVEDLSALAMCPCLEVLNITGCNIETCSPLEFCPALQRVYIDNPELKTDRDYWVMVEEVQSFPSRRQRCLA